MKVKRTRWTSEQVENFRQWHSALIKRLYDKDKDLIKELSRAREKFLAAVAPRP